MGRKKGLPKTGGRQAGTPNKVSGTLKDFFSSLIDDSKEQIVLDLKALSPKDRLSIIERLLQYILPKQQAVSADVNTSFLGEVKFNTKHFLDGKEITEDEYDDLVGDYPQSEDEVDLERGWKDYPNVRSVVCLEKS